MFSLKSSLNEEKKKKCQKNCLFFMPCPVCVLIILKSGSSRDSYIRIHNVSYADLYLGSREDLLFNYPSQVESRFLSTHSSSFVILQTISLWCTIIPLHEI